MSKKLYLPNKFKILRDVEEMVNQRGMTFIEVLVALFILVTGILGAVAMQTIAKQSSFDAMQRSLASALAQDIVERMRINSADALVLASYNGTYGATALPAPTRCNVVADNCDAAQMTSNDLFEWSQALRGAEATINGVNAGGLINARGCIQAVNQVVNISISWEGRFETSDGATGKDTDCGSGSITNKKRRQVTLTAFLF